MVILIDDDPRYSKSLVDDAGDEDLQLEYYQFLDEAISAIKEQPDVFGFAIIDMKGQLNQDSISDDETHWVEAISEFKALEQENIYIPFAFNTAYSGNKSIPQKYKLFKKNREEQLLFRFIKSQINTSSLISNKFPVVYNVFKQNYLENKLESIFIKTAHNYLNRDFSQPKEFAGNIRTIQVAAFNKIKEMYPNIAPGEYLNSPNERSKVTTIIKQLSGRDHTNDIDFLGDDMRNLTTFLYFQCSTIIHDGEEDNIYCYSNNIFPILFLSLNEFLLWYLHFVENAPKQI